MIPGATEDAAADGDGTTTIHGASPSAPGIALLVPAIDADEGIPRGDGGAGLNRAGLRGHTGPADWT